MYIRTIMSYEICKGKFPGAVQGSWLPRDNDPMVRQAELSDDFKKKKAYLSLIIKSYRRVKMSLREIDNYIKEEGL